MIPAPLDAPTCIGQHGLLDLWGIDTALASNETLIKQHLLEAARLAHATVLQAHFHHFGPNKGVTGIILLSESHISIHTWPEHQFAAIDIFMCGQHQIHTAIEYLKTAFHPEHSTFEHHARGEKLISGK